MKYLLALAIGYGITMTWLAHEFAMENQQLTYDLNVSQTNCNKVEPLYIDVNGELYDFVKEKL